MSNLSEEEKKAIEKLKEAQYRMIKPTMLKDVKYTNEDYTEVIDTILNLIEKQQKEIERLKQVEQAHKEENGKLRVELEKEKEKNKKAIDFINERKKTVNKDMAEGTRLQVGTFMWQVDELLEILKED